VDRGRQAVALCGASLDAYRRSHDGDHPALTDALLLVEGRLDAAAGDGDELTDIDVERVIEATASLVEGTEAADSP
jgi:hypothetical protein